MATVGTTPRTLLWLVEGELYAGTLDDYALGLDAASLGGLAISDRVWEVTIGTDDRPVLVERKPDVSHSGYDADDWATVTVRVADEVASYRADGRA
jgi:hypothetical protein